MARKKRAAPKNNSKTVTQNITITRRQPVRRRVRRRRNRARNNTGDHLLAELIANPCTGPLVNVVAGSSITERLRTTISPGGGANGSGYLFWFPSFHNYSNGADTPMNAFYFEGTAGGATPFNTQAAPMGTGTPSTTGLAVSDPVGPLLIANVYSRAQTLSACAQIEYIGPLQSISGQVALIPNISMRAFNTAINTPTVTPVSVDSLFNYASVRERLQVTGHEVVWRPSPEESVPRTGGGEYNSVTAYIGPRPNAPMMLGTPGTDGTLISAETSDSLGICIAWKGMPNIANCLSINLVKTVGLELTPSSAIQAPFRPTVSTTGPSPFNTITSWLDRNAPNWQAHAMNRTVGVAGALARAYAPRLIDRILPRRNRGSLRIQDL